MLSSVIYTEPFQLWLVLCSLLTTLWRLLESSPIVHTNLLKKQKTNIQPEFVSGYTKSDGTKVKSHSRVGKQFKRNEWIGVPSHIRNRDPRYWEYLSWREQMGLNK